LKSNFTKKKAFRVVNRSTTCQEFTAFGTALLGHTNIVSIDEAGFYIGDHGRYGYSRKGNRLNVPADRGLRRAKLTLLMAVSTSGILGYKILDHNCRKPDFVSFIQSLPLTAKDTVVMDNIAFHHSQHTKAALAAKQCHTLYTIPYSPKCNTIEMVFGALKPTYRRRCPSRPCPEFDYKQLLVDVLEGWRRRDMSRFFLHTSAWVKDTLAKAVRGDDLSAVGYDH
jgi:transposase